MFNDLLFDHFDGHRVGVDRQCARCFTWSWADSACELWEVVRCVKTLGSFLPVPVVDEVVELWYKVSEWATAVAERNSAIHTATCVST
jgi:hypothetical protein